MAEPKPFASLSSGLLARKGAAKPAMRPQGFSQMGVSLEDLGWNDMGQPHPHEAPYEHVPSPIDALTPAPRAAEPPAVVEQQRAIAATFAAPAPQPAKARAPKPAPAMPAAPEPLANGKPRSAFTLRLDPQRHLKLRLACAVANRSAQQIVTEALDDFLSSRPELDGLASQVSPNNGTRVAKAGVRK